MQDNCRQNPRRGYSLKPDHDSTWIWNCQPNYKKCAPSAIAVADDNDEEEEEQEEKKEEKEDAQKPSNQW